MYFIDVEAAGDYYNVEGGVGSRIAQQLQKGDKIRIGINGNVQTQDLKVKKWVKEDSFVYVLLCFLHFMKQNLGYQLLKI